MTDRHLFHRPDAIETRFCLLWTGASIVIALMHIAALEAFAAAQPGLNALNSEDAGATAAAVESLALLALIVVSPVLPWLTLSPLYQRPSLANLIVWTAVAHVLAYFVFGALIVMMVTPTPGDLAPVSLPLWGFLVISLGDAIAKFGYVAAFMFVGWRPAFCLAIAFCLVTWALIPFGASSWTVEIVETLEKPQIDYVSGQGISFGDAVLLIVEMAIIGIASALAIVIGFRWHKRDVELRIFE
ncbi:MAG: hypothetical protein AAF666_05385 [Pseudomonadota bacterium]